tara:strand:+ start:484 stop:681 length:198 start_codon:yes stop_codon:yes gene_type:complete
MAPDDRTTHDVKILFEFTTGEWAALLDAIEYTLEQWNAPPFLVYMRADAASELVKVKERMDRYFD